VIERVAQEMHVAALIGRLRENLAQCCPQAGMIVGHDKFDAMQTTGLQPEQEIAPARPALAVGELDRQYLAAAVPVDADRDQHRLAGDHAGLAHPLIARVEDQIGEGFGQGATGKLRQTRIQPLVHCTDRRSRKAVAAQLLGDRLHPRFREGRLLRVETPCTYISARAATSARSER
jgi:hypothetical protein